MKATSDASQPAADLTYRHPSRIAWFVAVSLLLLGGDLWLKDWAFKHVPAAGPVEFNKEEDPTAAHAMRHVGPDDEIVLVPSVLSLRLTLNRGAVFGLGQGYGWVFVLFTLVAVSVIVGVLAMSPISHLPLHIALMLVCGGALGNLYDRITLPGVRDMLHLFPDVQLPFGWNWWSGDTSLYPWIFNLADVYLLVGIGVIMIRYVLFAPRVAETAAVSD